VQANASMPAPEIGVGIEAFVYPFLPSSAFDQSRSHISYCDITRVL